MQKIQVAVLTTSVKHWICRPDKLILWFRMNPSTQAVEPPAYRPSVYQILQRSELLGCRSTHRNYGSAWLPCSTYLNISISTYPSTYKHLSICYLSTYNYMSACLVYQSSLYLYLSICLSVCRSVSPSVCLSTFVYLPLTIYLSYLSYPIILF